MDFVSGTKKEEEIIINSDVSIPNIKNSRLTRQEQMKRNSFFHKKNPKAIKVMTSNIEIEKKVNKEIKVEQEEVVEIKPKLKNQLQFFYHSLEKSLKRDGVFLQSDKNFKKIYALKDFNVQVALLKNKRHNLNLRVVVGVWEDFFEMVKKDPQNFIEVKNQFYNWLDKKNRDLEVQNSAQDFFDSYFYNETIDKKIIPYLPKLEESFLKNLKRPGKQPNGYQEKGESLYDLWFEQAQEINYIEQIETKLNLQSYEETFELARRMKRKISIFIGPTNSGKTYEALNELEKSQSGVYLAPLRLMAAEGQEALFERGVITNLITGEEQKLIEEATHTSSTIEMCNLNKIIDVAVIDEIQMIADKSRGWAWSQALIGVPAKHVVLVGSQEALPFIIPVIEELGEEYEIKTFERKAPLTYRDPIWRLQDLKQGDCVVVFSRKSALEMKNSIEATGKKCSVIYGNLSPEVRRSEANKFKNGDNPILVATDAIGMGLNLPINRLFFSTLEKFDGEDNRFLTISEIKQIAGRAGRYGLTQTGEVGLMADNSFQRNELLKQAIYKGYENAEDTRISIGPNLQQIKTICDVLGKEDLYSALIFFKEKLIRNHEFYKTANLESMIEIAALIKNKKLDLSTGLNYACVPLDSNSDYHVKTFFKWVNQHIRGIENLAPDLPEVISLQKTDSYSLFEAENYVKLCMAYRWLHYKYPEAYPEVAIVTKNSKLTNEFIEKTLHKHITISKNPKWRNSK